MSTRKKFYLAKSNQDGGTLENDLKEFSKYLMELIGATTDEELKNFVKEQGPEKVNEIYKQWKEQVPMAKDGMQFVNKLAVESQKALIPGNIAIRNKIQDTGQDDLRGISSFKEAFAEARSRGLKQFSWGKGVYTTELTQPTNKSTDKQITKKSTEEKSATPTNKKKESVNTVVEKKGEDTNREVPEYLKRRDTSVQAGAIPKWYAYRTRFVPSKGESTTKPAAKPAAKGGSTATKTKAKTSTPTPTPTPLQPVDPLRALGLVVGTAGAVTAVGAGTIYGADKYAKYKADKLRAASASPSATSAPSAAPRARATSGTLTARPSAPKFGSTSR